MKLKLSSDLSLPLEAVTQKMGFIGVSGSGKSYGASKLAELMWEARAQFIVLDPVGIWYGLRLANNGKGTGIPIPVFGGLHGDIPLEATGGELIANLIADKGISAVIDVSQFDSDAQKARFASDFARAFFFRKKKSPSAVHIFIEECQEFVPQNPQRGEEMMLHNFHRLQKIGRNFGIGTSLITQRPQETSKKALNQAQTLFVFRLTGEHERKAIQGWISDKDLPLDLMNDLPKIQTGHCHFWSPAWMQMSKMVHIAKKGTFDASKTPEVGVQAVARELAPIDLERIRKDMAATIEKVKAEDPRELRLEISELKALLAHAQAQAKLKKPLVYNKVEEKVIQIPVFKEGQIKRLEKMADHLQAAAGEAAIAATEVKKIVIHAMDVARVAAAATTHKPSAGGNGSHVSPHTAVAHNELVRLATKPIPKDGPMMTYNPRFGAIPKRVGGYDPDNQSGITPARQRILNALLWLENLGVTPANRIQAAFLAGQSPKSSGYRNNLGALRSVSFIEYVGGDSIALTQSGRSEAKLVNIPKTSEQIHHQVMALLSPARWRILNALISVWPKSATRETVAYASGQSITSSGYRNNLGALRSLGVIEYVQGGELKASAIMFLNEVAA